MTFIWDSPADTWDQATDTWDIEAPVNGYTNPKAGAQYEVLAADLKTGIIREAIPFDSLQYGRTLNAAGAFSGTISTRHPKATRENLDPSRTLIHVLRNGVCQWSGILWTALADIGEQNQLQVGGEGYFSYFAGPGGQASQGRFLKTDKVYTASDQLSIVQDIITWAQAQPGGDLGIVIGDETSGQIIARTYLATERHNIGSLITDLAGDTNAFDFSFDTDFSTGSPITTLHLWYPMQGRTATDLVFELGSNISQLQWSVDGTLQANSVDIVGQGTSGVTPIGSAADTSALSAYPLLESVQQAKATGTIDVPTLTSEAQSYLNTVDAPVETLPMLMSLVRSDIQPGVWTMGDWVNVVAHDGYVDFDETFRITADQVSVDSEGSEQVQITFEQAATFS